MKIIATTNAPGAIGPYSQGYEAGGFVYTSGQIPVNPADGTIPQGIEAQAHQSCRNVGAILEAGGTSFEKVWRIWMTSLPLTQFTPSILSASLPEAVLL